MTKIKITLVLLLSIVSNAITAQAIEVERIGTGNPVIFLPGFSTPGSVWKATVANLKNKNEVHLVSYAGFNGIAPIAMPWYATIKNELIAYIKDQKLSKVSIIGHSMGGNLAVDLAAALPNSIEQLLIVDALPCMRELMMPGVPVESLQYDSPYNKQMLAMNAASFKTMVTRMVSYMTNNKEKTEELINWTIAADRETYVYGYTDLLKLDLRTVLNQVKAKTVILGASFPDVAVAEGNYEKQYANLADKAIIMASDSKHFIMFDQPEWFYKQVNLFLKND